jgi:MFS family permease
MSTLMAPFVADVLHGDARAYGLILSAQAIGGIAGGVLTTLFGHRFDPRALLGWGTVAFGVIDLTMFLYPLIDRVLWPAPVLMVIVGLPGALLMAGQMTLFQTATGDAHRGRVFGALVAVDGVAMLAGTIAAGALAERVGIVPVIAAQGVGPILAGVLILIALPGNVVGPWQHRRRAFLSGSSLRSDLVDRAARRSRVRAPRRDSRVVAGDR